MEDHNGRKRADSQNRCPKANSALNKSTKRKRKVRAHCWEDREPGRAFDMEETTTMERGVQQPWMAQHQEEPCSKVTTGSERIRARKILTPGEPETKRWPQSQIAQHQEDPSTNLSSVPSPTWCP
ncbi:hypothetical protein NDU88_000224 [Pleurodeles waltl]|uniref:Uncharacterized protein n=1 Tax=Pleurodeles waltl TaxID=8319 RepID=A0AAV7KNE8_PLEWA|nr:hypothetical protein NDU88_000224 [Pleurodeles waltl]